MSASIISTIFLLLLHPRAADNVSTSIIPVVQVNLGASSAGLASGEYIICCSLSTAIIYYISIYYLNHFSSPASCQSRG